MRAAAQPSKYTARNYQKQESVRKHKKASESIRKKPSESVRKREKYQKPSEDSVWVLAEGSGTERKTL